MLAAFNLRDEALTLQYLDKITDPEVKELALRLKPVAQMALFQNKQEESDVNEKVAQTLITLKNIQNSDLRLQRYLYLESEKGGRIFIDQSYLGISPVFYRVTQQDDLLARAISDRGRGEILIRPETLENEFTSLWIEILPENTRSQPATRVPVLPPQVLQKTPEVAVIPVLPEVPEVAAIPVLPEVPKAPTEKPQPPKPSPSVSKTQGVPFTPTVLLPEFESIELGELPALANKIRIALDRGWWINAPEWKVFEDALRSKSLDLTLAPSLAKSFGELRDQALVRIDEEKKMRDSIAYMEGETSPYLWGAFGSMGVGVGFLGGLGVSIYLRGEAADLVRVSGLTPEIQSKIDQSTLFAVASGAAVVAAVGTGVWLFLMENDDKAIRQAGMGMGTLDKAQREYRTRLPPGIFEPVKE